MPYILKVKKTPATIVSFEYLQTASKSQMDDILNPKPYIETFSFGTKEQALNYIEKLKGDLNGKKNKSKA